MPAPLQDLSAASLLAIFAHPDDESLACGGLLTWCTEVGARVSLLCLTHGEHGPGHEDDGLRDIRASELQEASRILGIHDVVVLDHEDGMLPWIDKTLLEADILRAIHRLQPHLVVTFDEDGLYWHPDHVAVHERVSTVVAGLGTSAPALYYVSMPAGAMRSVAEAASSHRDRPPGPMLGVSDPDAFGSMAPAPTLIADVGRFADRKLNALRCHQSQVEGTALDDLDERDAARFLGTEHYRRADVGSRADVFIERLGIPVSSGG
jgi:N-acetyl-1-D-myo-inositol-2-amino-2-deoxy-alpha-D-glucopyranoside deacetylase